MYTHRLHFKNSLFFFSFFLFLLSCNSDPGLKLSAKQQKLADFMSRYQSSVALEPNVGAKEKIAGEMWLKHVTFIQDTLQSSIFTIDTFVFKQATITETPQPNSTNTLLQVLLDNGNYAIETNYSYNEKEHINLEKEHISLEGDIITMIKKLKPGHPVAAIGNLKGLYLANPSVSEGMKKIFFDFRLDAVYNPK